MAGPARRRAGGPMTASGVLAQGAGEPLLQLRGLSVSIGAVQAVSDLSLTLYAGQTVAIVGESGSGKSVTAMSVLGLLPAHANISGSIRYRAQQGWQEALTLRASALRAFRGAEVAMIFQEPMTSLNPVLSIGEQIVEALRLHNPGLSRKQAWARAGAALEEVGVHVAQGRLRWWRRATSRLDQFPHEFSGGMRQRVMIAMALACNPRVLIADEPTTALDVSIRAQVLDLLHRLGKSRGLGLLLITHDLGTVRRYADVVAVMRRGQMLEYGTTAQVLERPMHAYTDALLRCEPSLATRGSPLATVQDVMGASAVSQLPYQGGGTGDSPRAGKGQETSGISQGRLVRIEPNRWVRIYGDGHAEGEDRGNAAAASAADGERAPGDDSAPDIGPNGGEGVREEVGACRHDAASRGRSG